LKRKKTKQKKGGKEKSSSRHVLVIIEFACQVANDPNIWQTISLVISNLFMEREEKEHRQMQRRIQTTHVCPHIHTKSYREVTVLNKIKN
jgi:hypothetical protein